MGEKFWVEDPCVLLSNLRVFPMREMTRDEKLNALTRLALLITLVMYAMEYKQWINFLLISLLVVVILKYSGDNCNDRAPREDFTIVPTYTGTDFHQTTVTPTFAEEWHVPPPAYDIYTNVPPPDTFDEPLRPQSYPYGQYLTKTNLLPSDEYHAHQGCGRARTAREYINSAFLRHDLAFRDNMTRIFKKKLARRFRHNCNDTFSPYHSY